RLLFAQPCRVVRRALSNIPPPQSRSLSDTDECGFPLTPTCFRHPAPTRSFGSQRTHGGHSRIRTSEEWAGGTGPLS
ncbi:unnamed protein product, partial [Mycena citricolor]